jgi:hypothetical protein
MAVEQSVHKPLLGSTLRRTSIGQMKTFGIRTIITVAVTALAVSSPLVFHACVSRDQSSPKEVHVVKEEHGRLVESAHVEASQKGMQALLDSYKNSITLYGKVVDQHGEPVPDATVEISVHSSYFNEKSGMDAVLKTDAIGRFSISGFKGSSIGATAMKDGYLRIPPMSSRTSSVSLSYERGGSGTGDRHADPSNPIVLELLKIDPMEPLIHIDKRRWKLPIDGTPKKIALDSEEGRGAHEIEFRFTSDTHSRREPGRSVYDSFDWSFEIRIPGGGLASDRSDLEFEAPATGYKESVRYEFPATMQREDWKRVRQGRYFVKFADDTYGRIQFSIDGGSDRSPLYMESWLSAKPGSRNLATENMIINVIESDEPGQ